MASRSLTTASASQSGYELLATDVFTTSAVRTPGSCWYQKLGVLTPFDAFDTLVTSPVMSSLVLAIMRLTFALYTLFTLIFIFAWEGVQYHAAGTLLSYFTDLSYIGLCAYFRAAGVQTVFYVLGKERGYPLQRWPRPLQFLHLLLFSTITTFPILVTLVFWAILLSDSTFETVYSAWSNVSEHALNTVFCSVEVLLTHAGPTPWTHVPFLVFFLVCYLGVAYITHATQGFYTYDFLDPQKEHARLIGWILGIGVAGVGIFAMMRMLCVFRERGFARWAGSSCTEGRNSRDDRSGDWVPFESFAQTVVFQDDDVPGEERVTQV